MAVLLLASPVSHKVYGSFADENRFSAYGSVHGPRHRLHPRRIRRVPAHEEGLDSRSGSEMRDLRQRHVHDVLPFRGRRAHTVGVCAADRPGHFRTWQLVLQYYVHAERYCACLISRDAIWDDRMRRSTRFDAVHADDWNAGGQRRLI